MTSVGETLRRERLRRHLELDRISRELKISPRLLEAMEADRFDKLPGGVFTRSFVKQYARQLGLDEQEISTSLERMLNPPSVASEGADSRPKEPTPIALERVFDPIQDWLAVASESRFSWLRAFRSLGLVVVVALLCAAIYTRLQPRQGAVRGANRAPTSPTSTAPRTIAGVPAQPQVPPPPPAPATATASTAGAGTAERLDIPIRVEVEASEPCWIFVTADGKEAFSGIILPNANRTFEANDRVLLKLGNAGGARLRLNGKPVGPFGANGEVVRVQFTSGGFQIVPAEAPTPEEGPKDSGESRKDPLDPL
jgi:cytoskeleton protein RodZ